MAYHDTLHATSATDLAHRVVHAIKTALSTVGQAMAAGSTANHRLQIVQRLNEKSDAELAALGIRRENIVRRVFIDMLDV